MSMTVTDNVIKLVVQMPVYKLYASTGTIIVNQPSDAYPQDVGFTADAGDDSKLARADHVHALYLDTIKELLRNGVGPIDFNDQRLTNVGYPTAADDAATKSYVDAVAGSGGGGSAELVDDDSPGIVPHLESLQGAVLFDNGDNTVSWRQITQDDIQPAFAAALSGGGTLEVGQSVVNPSFTVGYTNGPPNSASLTDTEGNPTINLSSPFTAVTSPHTFSKTALNATVTFTLSATKGAVTRQSTAAYAWRPRGFWGVGAIPGSLNEAFVEALANSGLQSSRARSFTLSTSAGEYMWYAYPASYGAATFTVGGFSGGFILAGTVSVTNAYGVTQTHNVYRSTNQNLGSQAVVVS